MGYRNLSPQAMVNISAPWLDPAQDRKVFTSLPLLAPLLPAVEEAHGRILTTQRLGSSLQQQMKALIERALALDATHDRKLRGAYNYLGALAEMTDDPELAAALLAGARAAPRPRPSPRRLPTPRRPPPTRTIPSTAPEPGAPYLLGTSNTPAQGRAKVGTLLELPSSTPVEVSNLPFFAACQGVRGCPLAPIGGRWRSRGRCLTPKRLRAAISRKMSYVEVPPGSGCE